MFAYLLISSSLSIGRNKKDNALRTENIVVICVVIPVKRSSVTVDMHHAPDIGAAQPHKCDIYVNFALWFSHQQLKFSWTESAQKKKKPMTKTALVLCMGVAGQSLGWVTSFYFSWLGKITCFDKTNQLWCNMCNPRSQRHSGSRPFHWILCTWPSSLSRPWWLWYWCYARLRSTHTVKGLDRSKEKWA